MATQINISEFALDYMTKLSEVLDQEILRYYSDIVETVEDGDDSQQDAERLRLIILDQICSRSEDTDRLDRIVSNKSGKSEFLDRLKQDWERLPHRLVAKHWHLVRQVAATYHIDVKYDNDQEFNDIVGVAQEVLYQSAKKYMRRPRGDFKSFVWPILRQKIKEEQGRKHPVPFKIRKKLRALGDLREAYSYRTDVTLTKDVVRDALQLSEQELDELLSIEAVWGNGAEIESDVVIEDIEEPDLSPNALAILVSIENEALLKEAIDQLNDKEKALIHGLYFQDHSARELAETLDIPLNVLKKNHKKALKRLRQIVDGES
ncbi:sigma-70 family RNA polymerase sigma factor [Pseudobacteriovorax antillogorgiicola]|uniref:RNA polymerase sigma factor, sigma-70 family n=1 Tax=Pseudobacteriovorax antillogorgiicola TaxID=1513793 RepID=A0A1Y6B899_9BACT|nr:sigma-70 family RNA polymerase sigma factor [Pseudobacteriovorax antillogorgiicola]TCS58511.1 RNA polymerase sigma factor (sigma-70 family) [Pseudobacteriovorax antillogorgiicola]SME98112.1 RNA polymerase sigma factor, sigma-70 family [Pseudobacteriovorax antillogorgiicola]